MSDSILRRTVKIVNPQGLHLRPADMFAKLAAKFDARIDVAKGDLQCDGKSVLSILTLGADQGAQVELAAEGPDAQEAIDSLARLVESGFATETEVG